MKTKITFLIIAFTALTTVTAFAQEKDPAFYLKVYGGYSLFTPGSDLFTRSGELLADNTTGSFSQNKKGAGSGFNYGFGIAKPLGKLWIAGIDLNYLNGQKLSNLDIENYSVPTDNYTSKITNSAIQSHSVLSVIPNISFKVLPKPGYFVYTKLGVIVAVNTQSQYMLTTNVDFSSTTGGPGHTFTTQTSQYKYGLNIGLQGAAGVQFKITNRVSGFCELTGNFLSVKQTSSTTDGTYTENGQLTQIFHYQINNQKSSSGTITKQQVTTTNGNTTTYNVTENDAAFTEHINSIVLNVGIIVGFK